MWDAWPGACGCFFFSHYKEIFTKRQPFLLTPFWFSGILNEGASEISQSIQSRILFSGAAAASLAAGQIAGFRIRPGKVVMDMEIQVGMRGEAEALAEREDTALEVGSGDLLVYATPCMAALMEGAACEAIAGALREDQTTVGISLHLEHTSATPVGMAVRAQAQVTAVEGKIITFEIQAFDEAGPIGTATHRRAVVSRQKFLDKAYSKL